MSDQWDQQPPWGQSLSPNQQPPSLSPSSNQQQWSPQSTFNQHVWEQYSPDAGGQFQPFKLKQIQYSQPPKKTNRAWLIFGIISALVFCGVCDVIGGFYFEAFNIGKIVQATTSTTSANMMQNTQVNAQPTVTAIPIATPISSLLTPTSTETAAQIETSYKASTTSTTVTSLDTVGNNDQGQNVYFKCKILNSVRDTNGAIAGANVSDIDSSSNSVIEVLFPDNTDVTQVNQGDTLEVWGLDTGMADETSTDGTSIQEVVVLALYIDDQTTGYQAGD
jgi:hypothetical protein